METVPHPVHAARRPDWYDPAMARLFARDQLDQALIASAIRDLMQGNADEVHAAAFLSALRVKGESAEEIAVAAMVLRESMVRIDTSTAPIIDTCGTGGDDAGTFNISTCAALVASAAGVHVVKHGNRAVSGKTGSADVLRELGFPIESGVEWARQSLARHGFAFCFAPHFHPAMAAVAPLRRALGVRTIFNLLGPLSNPASAPYQLIGVGKPELLDPIAGAIAILGTNRTAVVHGCDGLDEVTLSGITHVRLVERGIVRSVQWTPEQFDLERATISDILAADANQSATMIRQVINNEPGPAMRFTVANAAAALWLTGEYDSLKSAAVAAQHAIHSGAAARLLARMTDERTEPCREKS
jgi:anthranilate phosphoribosyltransferase